MNKQTNTGWYVLGGLVLFVYMAAQLSKTQSTNTNTPPIDSSSAPDTANSPEIIISGKN